MLNARTAREWLTKGTEGKADVKDVLGKQFIAVSSAVEKAKEFGIMEEVRARERERKSGESSRSPINPPQLMPPRLAKSLERLRILGLGRWSLLRMFLRRCRPPLPTVFLPRYGVLPLRR
jgi:hypothetical protein